MEHIGGALRHLAQENNIEFSVSKRQQKALTRPDMRSAGFALVFASCLPVVFADDARMEEFFEMRVRPVLARNCLGCHGASKMGGLAMVSRDSLLKGGASGPAISANSPEHSLMIKVLRHELVNSG